MNGVYLLKYCGKPFIVILLAFIALNSPHLYKFKKNCTIFALQSIYYQPLLYSHFQLPRLMKKNIVVAFALLAFKTTILAQLMPGFEQSPYAGIHTVTYNPASIANSPYRFHINIVSLHGGYDNNLFGFSKKDLFARNFNNYQKTNNDNEKKGIANYGASLPSLMFNISPTSTVAITNRFRKMATLTGLGGNTAQLLGDSVDFNAISGQLFNNPKALFNFNTWFETGVSFAHIFLDNGSMLIKGGATLKYLKGITSGYIYTDNLSFKFIGTNATNSLNRITETNGKIAYGYSANADRIIAKQQIITDFSKTAGQSGFGADAGVEVEWLDTEADYDNHQHYRPHTLKVGVGVTDFGKLTYNNSSAAASISLANTSISIDNLSQKTDETVEEFATRMHYLFNGDSGAATYTMALPMAVHAYADFKVKERFYCNAFATVPLTSPGKNKLGTAYLYALTVTPRYETKNITVALPISFNELKQLNAGIAFRGGPFFFGSGSILTNLFSSNISHANVYGGIAIGIKGNKQIIERKRIVLQEDIKRAEYAAKNVYFESDKTNLIGSSYEALDSMASFLKKNPTAKLVVEGHTDSTGSKDNNLMLSQSRADAVIEYLKQKGISEARLVSVGYGTTKPIATNNNLEGRAKNRRVEFKIINGGKRRKE
jgi:outer membrane protein OmpA-like peptidoglycan-associated protein